MTPERKAQIRQRFREKWLEDALQSLGDAVESLTESEDYQNLWELVNVARNAIRQKLKEVQENAT